MSKQGRIRTQAMREAQVEAARRQKQRQRLLVILGGLVVVGLVVAIVVVLVQSARGGDDSPAAGSGSGSGAAPRGLVDDGAIGVGKKSAPVKLEIYFDYMCPACGAFEKANSGELDTMVKSGEAYVELRPISFLDRTSQGTKYSTRAANAIATVADEAPEDVWAFHTALYKNQPQEGSSGLSDDQIADVARRAGVPDAVVQRFGDRDFEKWVGSTTAAAFKSGVQGTPTVKIDGEEFSGDLYTTGPLTEAVRAAAKAK